MRRWSDICRCVAAGGLLAAACVSADETLDQPLSLSDRQPLVQLYNLPGARSGAILAQDRTDIRLGFDVANNFASGDNRRESVSLDGESRRLELGLRRGVGNDWEVGFSVPWISYSGGSLDNFIEHWHDAFGLPDGGRPDARRNQLRFQYQRAGKTELDFDRSEAGIGDVQLNAAYSLLRTTDTAMALAAAINLPTGDADKLTGAEATNISVALAATRYALFGLPLTGTLNIGPMWLDRGELLGDRQKDVVWFGSAELGWAVADGWRLKAQLAAHTAFYHSDLRELGSNSVQLLLGGSVRLAPRWYLDIAVGEDVEVDTAPDVTFQLALKAAL